MELVSMEGKVCLMNHGIKQYLLVIRGSSVYVSLLPSRIQFSRVSDANENIRLYTTKGVEYTLLSTFKLVLNLEIKYELEPYGIDITDIFKEMLNVLPKCKESRYIYNDVDI